MSDHTAYIIGVDIGTSSTKSIVRGMNGKILGVFQQAYLTDHPEPGYSEQDPEVILNAVIAGIRAVVAEVGGAPAAISFSSAMHSIMAIDGSGAALTPLIIWADNRSEPQALALRDTAEGRLIYRQTGTPVHAMSPLCKICWLREQQPALFARAVMFPGIKEYIFHHFFGRWVTDHSIASATGLFDIHTLRWNDTALGVAGITAAQLPVPVPANYQVSGLSPVLAATMGIPADTPFIIGGSDGCLAQLGSGAMDAGHATLTIGTSGAVRMAGKQPLTDARGRLFTYLLTDDIYITGGASNNGGVVLQWLVRDFLKQPLSALNDLVSEALHTDPGKLLCLPYLLGERAPVWNSHATAAFIGIQPQHTPAHFTRAVLEGICFALLSIKEALEETTGPVLKVSVSGGFTNAPGWIQLMADIFGQEMHLQQESDASALGAIQLAAGVLGWQDVAPEEAQTVFTPDAGKLAAYRKKYKVFLKLYEQIEESLAGE
ncbi:gluconokinase [Chitinophaga arvensicola]|uniref:Gluconate kinase, FGGY family n=1 Tax=Chitinophaga arvensicola TaxID=29529 RepID=A0A1I0P6C4_9BACT|nr:gluconokinase [Chitinophaga arvensicola]SEW09822.1 gluconate kinase, FGGY family [Chitinophaga arvensicola]